MSTRLISWAQEVTNADPNWSDDMHRPWIYDFSNGRRFKRASDPYAGSGVILGALYDLNGNLLLDGSGLPLLEA